MAYKLSYLNDNEGVIRATIISFDNCTLLLDPGWSGLCSYEDCLKFWKNWIPQIDIILLSQPLEQCLGSYAMLYYEFTKHFKSRIQVYSTLPVANLGRVTTIELYVSKGITGPYNTNIMDINDVEMAFDHISTVKYSQLVDLRSRCEGLGFIAYNSGFAPGGTIWRINNYSEKLLYAPRWNHTRDTILNSADLLDNSGKPSFALMRPSVVLSSSENVSPSTPYRTRALKFKEIVRKSLVSKTSVVIPSAIGSKFLELFVLINDLLYENKKLELQSEIPILLISYSRGCTLTYAKSMLEWMSSQLVKTWVSRDNKSPFDIGNRLKIVNINDLSNYTGTKICFVSMVDSLTNDVICKICSKENATLILTEKPDCTAQTISVLSKAYAKWEHAISTKNQHAIESNPILFSETILAQFVKTKPLTGIELADFLSKIELRNKERSELLATFESNENTSTNGLAFKDDDDDDDVDDDMLRPKDHGAFSVKVEMPIDILIKPTLANKHKMFPFQPGKISRDDYGDIVDFEQFVPKTYDKLKRPAYEEDDEEEYDPHEFENPRKAFNSGKRRRQDDINQGQISIDDLSHLETLNAPQQRILGQHKLSIRCPFVFIDLSGLVDTRSLSIIWPALKPRKMVLLPIENSENTTDIINQLKRKGLEVIRTEFNKKLTINMTLKSLDILIDPEMDQLLKWQRIGDGYAVAHVVGNLVHEKDPKLTHREKLVLKPLHNHNSRIQSENSLRIGDVRLAELKRNLTAKSHLAEFKGKGTLVVDGQVVVRKIGESETIVDGIPSELFYKVKSVVADMLANV